jgi:hypothetical protein
MRFANYHSDPFQQFKQLCLRYVLLAAQCGFNVATGGRVWLCGGWEKLGHALNSFFSRHRCPFYLPLLSFALLALSYANESTPNKAALIDAH